MTGQIVDHATVLTIVRECAAGASVHWRIDWVVEALQPETTSLATVHKLAVARRSVGEAHANEYVKLC